MKFIKNYNNNAALVEDQNHTEWIVLGKGIGFGMKAGMDIDDTKIAKRFIAEDSKDLEPENFKDLSQKAMEAAGDVAEMSKEKFGIAFNVFELPTIKIVGIASRDYIKKRYTLRT